MTTAQMFFVTAIFRQCKEINRTAKKCSLPNLLQEKITKNSTSEPRPRTLTSEFLSSCNFYSFFPLPSVSLHWQTLLFVSARTGHVSCMANKYHYIRRQGCKIMGAISKFLAPEL